MEIDAANELATLHHKVQAARGRLGEDPSPQVQLYYYDGDKMVADKAKQI